MHTPLADLLADLGAEEEDLLGRPSETAGEEGRGEALETRGEGLAAPVAELLVVLVLGPAANGPLELLLDDVSEAGVLEEGLVGRGGGEGTTELGAGLGEELAQAADVRVFGHGRVVARVGEVEVLHLEVAAGFQGAVAGRQRGEGLCGGLCTYANDFSTKAL